MEVIISEIISAILQIMVFTLIPLVVYLIKNKSAKGFFNYIGLVKTTKKALMLSLLTSVVMLSGTLVFVLLNEDVRTVMTSPPSITGKLHQMGLNSVSIAILIITACFKTSFAEEILFRGFIGRRLMNKYGYRKGNILQSIVFALLHLILFAALTKASYLFLLYIFVMSGIAAYLIGYVKVKFGKGSILPGWLAHGLGNTVSYAIIAYVI